MYMLFKSGDVLWCWDKTKKQMFEKDDEEQTGTPRNFDLVQASKFLPDLELVRQQESRPAWVPDIPVKDPTLPPT
jgi:hypothetical protein